MNDFLDTWALFHNEFLTALLLAALLPLCGIVLVLRHQVFLSAATGQAATLAIALGLCCGLGGSAVSGRHHHDADVLLFAVGAGALTAVLSMRALSTSGSQVEARSVWLFLAGSSLSMLVASGDPHGLEDVKQLTLSSLLGASAMDVWLAGGALGLTLLAVRVFGNRVLLWASDPVTAQVHGCPLLAYDLAVGGWLGICTGFALHATGLLFAFGLTVLPVLTVRELARSLRAVIWSAPLLGVVATAGGLVAAHVGDLPPGQAAVGGLVLLMPVAALGGWLRRAAR